MKHDPIAPLRIPDFRFFITARLFMTLATQMQGVVVGWQIYQLTKNPFWLGMIGLTEAIPFISTALFAGHVADIINRKKIIVVAMTLLAICTGLLCAFTLNNSSILLSTGIWPIYGIIFLSGILRAFVAPANFAFQSQIVPRNEYSSASTWSSSAWQAGAIGGPLIVAMVYKSLGITLTYGLDLVLVLIALFCYIIIPARPLPPKVQKESLFESLGKGIRFVFKNEIVLGALSLDLFAVFFGGAVSMLPVFADRMHVGVEGLSMLRAAPSVGAVLMLIVMIYKPVKHNAGRNLLICVAGFGVCMILFPIATFFNFWVAFGLLALSGAFDSVSVVVRGVILQLMTPDEMRGRVSAVNNIFIGSSNEIGEFESGTAAKIMGLVPSVIFGGCMTLLVVIYTAFRAKKLRRLHLGEEEK
ncbi:MAG TPA: MFS transporter [Bacteroidia bacterium]|nr:MFS transporter [Bacteroidia bacterium]